MEVESISGHGYYLSIDDQGSKASQAYLLPNKSSVAGALMEGIHTFEKVSPGQTVKAVQTDQAERLHRTLDESARALLLSSKLPRTFWGEAIRCANYIRNRLPVKASVEGKCPIELLTNKEPSLHNLRTFGCQAWVLIPAEKRIGKFGPKSVKGTFLGYGNSSTYRVLVKDQIVLSKNVEFVESTPGPAANQTQQDLEGQVLPELFPEPPQLQLSKLRSSYGLDGSVIPQGPSALDLTGSPNGERSPEYFAGAEFPQTFGSEQSIHPQSPANLEQVPPGQPDYVGDGRGNQQSQVPSSPPNQAIAQTTGNPQSTPAIQQHLQHSSSSRNDDLAGILDDGKGAHHVQAPSSPSPLGTQQEMQLQAPASPPASNPASSLAPPANPTHGYNLCPRSSKALKRTWKDDWMVSDEFSGYANAMRRSDADLWKEAIHEELTSLVANETWTLTELPPARKALTTTWVFKVKRDGGGDVERYKARLCVRGFEQREGLDYQEVFAPTFGKVTQRVYLTHAALKDYEIRQVDIKTAFLNAELDEPIYIQIPDGLKGKELDGNNHLVLKLNKSSYGLKQAPRLWFLHLINMLTKELGFVVNPIKDTILQKVNQETGKECILCIYVDDILLVAEDTHMIEEVIESICKGFQAKDLGAVSFFCGIVVHRDRKKTGYSHSMSMRR
eukprot:scaffold732_cov348-Pavlova_lutheri.AAC.2